MRPGPTQIIGCPQCGALACVGTLLSGNTFGAQWWTDGKMVAPMLPEQTEITRCRSCAAFYWVSDAQAVGEIDSFSPRYKPEEIPEEWRNAERIEELSGKEYLQAINEGLGKPRKRELYLRTRAWWAGNDVFRSQNGDQAGQPLPRRSPDATANLERLFKLLGTKDPNERLMKAEVARELGRFDEALELLKSKFPSDYTPVATLIKELSEAKDPMVREIPVDNG